MNRVFKDYLNWICDRLDRRYYGILSVEYLPRSRNALGAGVSLDGQDIICALRKSSEFSYRSELVGRLI